MPDDEYNWKKLNSDIVEIKGYVKDHDLILKGPKDSDIPGGLVYSTSENTKFRKFAVKILWLLFATVSGLVLQEAFGILKLLMQTS